MKRIEGRPSLIRHTTAGVVVPLAVLFSVYLLFVGHNQPGGGFVGGLVLGAAVALVYVDRGLEGLQRLLRLQPEVYVGAGLTLAALTSAAGWIWGTTFLDQEHWELDLAVLGVVKVATTLPFDIGVYLIVAGTVGAALRSLGEEPG